MDVLLIEDDPAMRAVLQSVLERRGHTVTAAEDGENGWQHYQSQDFSLVVLDWLLPGIDGLEVCRRIRRSPKGTDSLILVSTVRSSPGDLDLVLAAGADDYLAKPVELALLNIRLAIMEQRAAHIQQRKQAERSLLDAQKIAQMGSFEWHPVSDELHWSAEHYRLWGLEPHSVTPSYALLRQGIHPDDVAQTEAILQQALDGGGTYACEHRVVWPDGSEHHVRSCGEVRFDAAGQTRLMLGTVQDITALKKTEETMRAAKQQADAANRMLQTVLDTIPLRIFWKDRDLTYLGCNQLFAQDAGKSSPAELIGKTDYEMGWHKVADLYRSDDRAVIESGQPSLNFEEPQSHSDGSTSWLRTSKAPLRDSGGKVIGLLGTYEDITASKQAEQTLNLARQEAEDANRAKSEFLSRMSHELRTPLNAVLGFAQLLQMDTRDCTPDQRESVEHILTAGHHLLGLINDVLDVSRLELGKLTLDIEPLCAADICASCVNQIAMAMANRRAITIENRITDASLMLQGDNLRCSQVLINLLSNAVKYNQDNGRVTLSSRVEKEGWLRIEVRDTGPGIASDKLSLLFTPFERLDQSCGAISGVGIGLHIVKQLVEAMHGTVGVESEPGKGSTFWFELPLAKDAGAPRATTKTGRPSLPSGDSRFVILYIEDVDFNVKLVRHVLKNRPDIELITAGTAEEGLTLAEETLPDLILMDIGLPGIDGITATTLLKAVDRTCHIPVVALSAHAEQDDIDRALSAGCHAYLSKPFNLQELYAVIDEVQASKNDEKTNQAS